MKKQKMSTVATETKGNHGTFSESAIRINIKKSLEAVRAHRKKQLVNRPESNQEKALAK